MTENYIVIDDKLERYFWDKFTSITDYLDYMSDKCKWEQQGEYNARLFFPEYMEEVWDLDS